MTKNLNLKGYGMTESQNDGRTRQIQYSPHFFKAELQISGMFIEWSSTKRVMATEKLHLLKYVHSISLYKTFFFFNVDAYALWLLWQLKVPIDL